MDKVHAHVAKMLADKTLECIVCAQHMHDIAWRGMFWLSEHLVTATEGRPAANLQCLRQVAAHVEQPSAASTAHLLQHHQS